MQKPTETADQERIKEWHEEDYWMKMDFSPTWIFILPSIMLISVLGIALFIGSVLIASATS